ncbi:OsmC family protein [Phenylobacterium soli]|uniref:OsmC family peroxiredoxin n=1 Tax=Phenylobacterium soli TaxID=2170551 RepID=A0A328AFS3_9CAUL|nr:OsmC family protein [Phenylobacterium soli]RAK53385.1 OsmC family peroxiredoxin [Phenylobacterium soli]
MASYRATTDWTLQASPEDFLKGRYGRGHTLSFGSGVEVPGTASHHVVGNKWAAPNAVDPEEMLVGSLSTCHMLTFLHKAREAGFVVERYVDEAVGVMEKTPEGRMAVTRVTLRPAISYAGRAPSAEESEHLHHLAHEECFIANSVKTEVVVEEREPA